MTPSRFGSVPHKEVRAPNGSVAAVLRHSGTAPWENAFASLSLDDLPFGDRRFGWNAVWSSCSRYLAITEWRHTDPACGPDSQLLLVDVQRRRECVIDRAEGGFIDPVYINDGMVKYSFMTPAMTERAVDHRRIDDMVSWRPVSGSAFDEEQRRAEARMAFLDLPGSF